MGFTAIWITPITTQMEGTTADGSAYHGYWQQDMWVKYGTETYPKDKLTSYLQLWSQFRIWHGWWSALPHFGSSRPGHVHDGRCCCQSHGLSLRIKFLPSNDNLIYMVSRDMTAPETQLTTVFSTHLTLRSTSILIAKSPTTAIKQMSRIVGSVTRLFLYQI